MAKHRSSHKSFTLPILPLLGVSAPLTMVAPSYGYSPLQAIQTGDFNGALATLKQNYLGLDGAGAFNMQVAIKGWTPVVAGFAMHYIASKIGINRALGRAGVPIIRL